MHFFLSHNSVCLIWETTDQSIVLQNWTIRMDLAHCQAVLWLWESRARNLIKIRADLNVEKYLGLPKSLQNSLGDFSDGLEVAPRGWGKTFLPRIMHNYSLHTSHSDCSPPVLGTTVPVLTTPCSPICYYRIFQSTWKWQGILKISPLIKILPANKKKVLWWAKVSFSQGSHG